MGNGICELELPEELLATDINAEPSEYVLYIKQGVEEVPEQEYI